MWSFTTYSLKTGGPYDGHPFTTIVSWMWSPKACLTLKNMCINPTQSTRWFTRVMFKCLTQDIPVSLLIFTSFDHSHSLHRMGRHIQLFLPAQCIKRDLSMRRSLSGLTLVSYPRISCVTFIFSSTGVNLNTLCMNQHKYQTNIKSIVQSIDLYMGQQYTNMTDPGVDTLLLVSSYFPCISTLFVQKVCIIKIVFK